MSEKQLEGMWLNGFIRDMLEERGLEKAKMYGHGLGSVAHGPGGQGHGHRGEDMFNGMKHARNGAVNAPAHVVEGGAVRKGPTSRELSGEMGGDTTSN